MSSFFGRSFDRVRVHVGGDAARAAELCGAEALTVGEHIYFAPGHYAPHTTAGERLLVHELTHVVQQDGSGATASDGARASISNPREPGELEAERNAERFAAGLPARVTRGLTTRDRIMRRATGAFALEALALGRQQPSPTPELRAATTTKPAAVDSDSKLDRAPESELALEPEQDAQLETSDIGEQAQEFEVNEAPATEPELAASSPASTTTGGSAAGPSALAPAPEPSLRIVAAPEREPEAAPPERARDTEAPAPEQPATIGGGCVLNPRAEIDELVDRVETAWDEGARDLEQTEAEACASLATDDTESPHEVGSFGADQLPPTQSLPTLTEPAPRPRGADDQLSRAQAQIDRTLAPEQRDRTQPRGPIEAREAAHRRSEARRPLGEQLRRRPQVDEPTARVSQDPEAERARTRRELGGYQQGEQRKREEAKQRSRRDFGERDLGPRRDPTEGHDDVGASLRVQRFDAEAAVSRAQLDHVPTEDNVGTVPLSALVRVSEDDLAGPEQTLREQRDAQDRVDAQIESEQASLRRRCRAQDEHRDELTARVTREVDDHRESLRGELDTHGDARRREADRLTTEGSARADRIRGDADQRAADTMRRAHAERDARWRSTEDEAHRRAERASEGGFWDRAIEALRSALAAVLRPIRAFIEAARTAITAMLRAAAALAHSIVEHARRSVSAVLDHVRDSLAIMAANLPGEFGEIARRWEQRIDAALTRAQSLLDRWADATHALIDEGTNALTRIAQAGLDRLTANLDAAATALDTLLSDGFMAFVRLQFPALAELIDRGLLGPIQDLSAMVDAWLQGLLENAGLLRLQTALETIEQQHACGQLTAQLHDDLCEEFDQLVQDVIGEFDELLASPFVQEIQQALNDANNQDLDNQTSVLGNLFAFGQFVASTLLEWWDAIESAIAGLWTSLGSYACAAWRHIAAFLGLPLDVDPITALRRALDDLWATATAAVQPLIDRAVELWRWLREETFIADIIWLVQQARNAWNSIERLWNWLLAEGESWIAEMAEQFQRTILDPILAFLRVVGDALHDAVESLSAFVRGLIRRFDAALTWLAGMLGLDSLVRVIRTLLAPLRALALFVFDCFVLSLHGVADVIANLHRAIRVVLDIVVGIVIALMAFPVSLVLFLAGAVWTYLIPQCMKGPIIDFFLTIMLRLVTFFPVPNNVILAAIWAGAEGILTTLLAAPTEQKVRAIDLLAKVFAGDVEIGAGMVVGFLAAIWDSTVGLVITLIQALGWLFSWSAESLGVLEPEPDDDSAAAEDAFAAPSAELDDIEAEAELEEVPPGIDVEFGPPISDDVPGQTRAPETDEQSGSTGAAGQGVDFTRPPELPPEVTQIREFLQAFVDSQITAEELEAFLVSMRDHLVTVVRDSAGSAARSVLERLNAEGTGYTIGYAMGYVYGLVIVMVVLAILTGGVGSAAVSGELAATTTATTTARVAATVAGQGGRAASTTMRAIELLQRVAGPMLRAINGLRGTRLGPVIARLEQWFARMMQWLRPALGRAQTFVRQARAIWNSLPDWLRDGAQTWARWSFKAGVLARRAWQLLDLEMRDEMLSRSQLEARLYLLRRRMAGDVPRGARLQFRVEVEPGENRWHIVARLRQSLTSPVQHWTQRLMSASGESSSGWYATDERGGEWFSTDGDQSRTYDDVVERADELIESALGHARETTGSGDLDDLNEEIDDEMEGIEQRAGAALLRGVRLLIDEDHPEQGTEGGLPALIYNYVITPNTAVGTITASVAIRQRLDAMQVSFGPLTAAGFGTWVRARRLNNYTPSDNSPNAPRNHTYTTINSRRYGGRNASFYVQGHLLNGHLHGPGTTWRNLTPIFRTTNGNHEREVERVVKDAVQIAQQNGTAVEYNVFARYGRSAPSSSQLAALDPDRRRIAIAEQHVPTQLVCSAWRLDADGQRTQALLSPNPKTIDNSINPPDPQHYQIRSIPRRLTSLNLSNPFPTTRPGDDQVAELGYRRLGSPVGEGIARRLRNGAPYTSWEQVRAVHRLITSEVTDRWAASTTPRVHFNQGSTVWDPPY